MHRALKFILIFIACGSLAPSAVAQNCAGTSVGLMPLTELGTGTYRNFSGGLYPQGTNQRPAAHEAAGQLLAQQVQPLNATGIPDLVNGKIVLLSIGMSNTTQEFSVFKSLADADPAKNPRLVIVDGAQGGQTASTISNPNANFWSVIEQRLTSAGVTRQQVQVFWVKEANANPTQAFPVHAQTLQSQLEAIARILKDKYPNARLAFFSSRTYGGYATTTLNPEPYAYESGFSVKWMVEKQINGDTSLAFSGSAPRAPWLAWGPYLWGDGMRGGLGALVWECHDFQSDGTHPAASGRQKVADALLSFFKNDPTAVPWFLRSITGIERDDQPIPLAVHLEQNYPNPFNPTTTIEFYLPRTARITLKVFDTMGREIAVLADDQRSAGVHKVQWNAGLRPSGVYVYRFTSENSSESRAMLLLR
ncbi:MAG: T9SS type A sorting domain-containing protein [Ignavibacteria bacterium]|nr:T9SS type A sorting domain-containing protein [Ignavibacteria bacterium]